MFPKEQGEQKLTKISVGDDGAVTITYPNGNVDVVPSEDAVVGLPRYDVIFDENGYSFAPDKQNIIENEKALKPEDLTADGFVFGGWYKEATCENSYDFNTPVTAAITLYAKWSKIPEVVPAATQRIVPNTATK